MPIAFITGGSSGIGQALAEHYLQSGWRVALVARRLPPMQDWWHATQTRLGLEADTCLLMTGDVDRAEDMMACAAQCQAHWGLPDLVLANAGISLGVDSAHAEDLPVFAQVMQTNVMGVLHTVHPFVTPMRLRGSGHLVVVASVAGIRGLPGHAAYCASKAAAIAYAESLRGELKGTGVRVTTLAPGYVATPLTSRNRYPMPFLLSAPAFAKRAARAIATRDGLVVVPWPMAWVARLLRVLPDAWFDRALKGQPRKHRARDRQENQ